VRRETARASRHHYQLLWPDPHLQRFFLLVMLVIVGTLAQDMLLEPYGGRMFGIMPGSTTGLTALWGAGTVVAWQAQSRALHAGVCAILEVVGKRTTKHMHISIARYCSGSRAARLTDESRQCGTAERKKRHG